MEDKRYTMHSFRVGAAASHSMDGAAMGDALMTYAGWKFSAGAHRYVGMTGTRGRGGSKVVLTKRRPHIDADALSLSEQFESFICNVPTEKSKPEIAKRSR